MYTHYTSAGSQPTIFPTNTINPQQQQADRSDTKALVDFVLKCEGEWATAGHAKK